MNHIVSKKSVSIDDVNICMKCGFCMSACPVYQVNHIEGHVARGRNVLIKSINDGEIEVNNINEKILSYCLLCGRCEAVCPAKVPSASINILARTEAINKRGLSITQRILYRLLLKNRSLLATILGVASLIPGLSSKDGIPLRHMADALSIFTGGIKIPKLSKPFLDKRVPPVSMPADCNNIKGEIAIFPGCVFQYFFADAGKSMVNVLTKAGYSVHYPKNLTCCGQAVRSAGDLLTAQQMAKQNIESLIKYDKVVTGCATCGSAFKTYPVWFTDNIEWRSKAEKLSTKVYEFSQFILLSGYKPDSKLPYKVTYHDPCHMKWIQGISEEPRILLRSIPEVDYVELENADSCCGLGGAFSITHREISLEIQKKKIECISRSGAQIVATSCPGCIIQLVDGIKRNNLDIDVVHISQLLDGQKELLRKPQ